MSRILYIFPHPDDESFGPAAAISRQRKGGHEVYLLTLTRGEATSQRQKLGFSKEKMGSVRLGEMKDVARILELAGMEVLEYPDGGLDALDPLELEDVVRDHIGKIKPDVVVSYTTHGISGHLDHLVTHAVVKRVFCELRRSGAPHPRRLALFTVPEDAERPDHLHATPLADIDCIVPVDDDDLQRGRDALRAYKTYRDVVEAHKPMETVRGGVCFDLFQEEFQPPIDDVFEGL